MGAWTVILYHLKKISLSQARRSPNTPPPPRTITESVITSFITLQRKSLAVVSHLMHLGQGKSRITFQLNGSVCNAYRLAQRSVTLWHFSVHTADIYNLLTGCTDNVNIPATYYTLIYSFVGEVCVSWYLIFIYTDTRTDDQIRQCHDAFEVQEIRFDLALLLKLL